MADDRTITFYASVFGNVDLGNDTFSHLAMVMARNVSRR
jgi:hypothetical protein